MTDTARTSYAGKSETDMKSKLKEIPFVHDQGFFTFETGDTYEGYFEARKKDRSVKMHGYGIYKTAEGDTYEGIWENDKLGHSEEVVITYADGAKYKGNLKEWCYTAKGKYLYPDGCILQCNFQENVPINGLQLTDPNGHTWLGKAEQGYGWFNPVNHFFDILEQTRDTGISKKLSTIEPVILPTLATEALQPTTSRKSKVVIIPKKK